MTQETTDLVLEHLKRIQADLARSGEVQATQSAELLGIRLELGAHTTLLNQCIDDIAGVRVGPDRIERRFGLVDAGK